LQRAAATTATLDSTPSTMQNCSNKPRTPGLLRGTTILHGGPGCAERLLCLFGQAADRIEINVSAPSDGDLSVSSGVRNASGTLLSSALSYDLHFDRLHPDQQSITVPSPGLATAFNRSVGPPMGITARLQLRGASPSTSVTVRYHCIPSTLGEPMSWADFRVELVRRMAFPLSVMFFVATMVNRRRRHRRWRVTSVPENPPYATLREDAQVIIATLSSLPLLPYSQLQTPRDHEHEHESANAEGGAELSGAELSGAELSAQSSRQECGICLEPFADEQLLRVLPCRHFFCDACIVNWFETRVGAHLAVSGSLPCPLCKADALDIWNDPAGG